VTREKIKLKLSKLSKHWTLLHTTSSSLVGMGSFTVQEKTTFTTNKLEKLIKKTYKSH